MDVNFELVDLKFVWDSEKNEINWRKHKVRFEDVARIFLDEYRYDDFDELHSNFEDRIKTVGFVRNVLAEFILKEETEQELFRRVVLIEMRRLSILDNSSNKNIPPLTKEQIWRLYQLSKMSDDEIDYSDIPKITKEEWKGKFKPSRLRKQKQNIAS